MRKGGVSGKFHGWLILTNVKRYTTVADVRRRFPVSFAYGDDDQDG